MWVALPAALAILLTACSGTFPLPDVHLDLAPLAGTSGKALITTAEVKDAMRIDGSITATGTTGSITVRVVLADGSVDPTAIGCTAVAGAAGSYLCDATTSYLTTLGTVTLAPGQATSFSWDAGSTRPQAWLGVQLIGSGAGSGTITLSHVTGTYYGG